ncbi:nitrogenase component 1 [uncultured Megasphaera sp.]|uniref:nitrogenase component 1 n=1 Tax=uncultured Megasphaera sp. TaxID=165188 RepID=UPI002659700B|nr:nitrogenase component 1 [uncultured Megasphaera sp.]
MKSEHVPYAITVDELVQRGPEAIPSELVSSAHLIYNSPAALAFNSPGAQGFGVKRAGLAIPGSVMLLVGPGCCGRNTTILSEMGGYSNRFFFYLMDETDIVTGRHLKKIPQAVCEIVDSLAVRPSVVMICMTCVDALLGTDMERVCRKAADKAGLPVVPCYMYALTREGRKPPMVDVRRAVYSLLEPAPRHRRTVNILGYFSHLRDTCELYDILEQLGLRQIQEISRCQNFAEYQALAQANFNLVLHPEARLAALDMEKRLHIPSIELTRLYQIDKIHRQYQAFASALGGSIDDGAQLQETEDLAALMKSRFSGVTAAIGEMQNGNAFDMALALTQCGMIVKELYANVSAADFPYLRKLREISPHTLVYSNLSPSMLYYEGKEHPVDLTIGKDAAYYHDDAAHVLWNEEVQPFGYDGVREWFRQIMAALEGRRRA